MKKRGEYNYFYKGILGIFCDLPYIVLGMYVAWFFVGVYNL